MFYRHPQCSASGLSGKPTMLPVKVGPGTDGIFTSGMPSPLDDQRRSSLGKFFPLPEMNENRLNHGQSLKAINHSDQASHYCGKKICRLCQSCFFYKKSTNYASTIDKGRAVSCASAVAEQSDISILVGV